ncbi:hypothetical protein CV770_36320 [Bradyrhizobium sp. AC87j1]|nr:hypothetical protein CV770_36320 [Bradyrhizobium sp. AC87j1]
MYDWESRAVAFFWISFSISENFFLSVASFVIPSFSLEMRASRSFASLISRRVPDTRFIEWLALKKP